jgi:hypothetical protein
MYLLRTTPSPVTSLQNTLRRDTESGTSHPCPGHGNLEAALPEHVPGPTGHSAAVLGTLMTAGRNRKGPSVALEPQS